MTTIRKHTLTTEWDINLSKPCEFCNGMITSSHHGRTTTISDYSSIYSDGLDNVPKEMKEKFEQTHRGDISRDKKQIREDLIYKKKLLENYCVFCIHCRKFSSASYKKYFKKKGFSDFLFKWNQSKIPHNKKRDLYILITYILFSLIAVITFFYLLSSPMFYIGSGSTWVDNILIASLILLFLTFVILPFKSHKLLKKISNSSYKVGAEFRRYISNISEEEAFNIISKSCLEFENKLFPSYLPKYDDCLHTNTFAAFRRKLG